MNGRQLSRARAGYRLRTWALMLVMLASGPLVGWVLAGDIGAVGALAVGVVVLVSAPRLSARWLLIGRRARVLGPREAPGLAAMVETLSQRARLRPSPQLMIRPGALPEAFATGQGEASAIVITEGLLRTLPPAQIAGVLAHELVHLQSGDVALTRAAAVLFNLTRSLASVGWLMVLLTLPLVLVGACPFPWWVVLVIAAAPTIAGAAFMALSRVRELEADAGAAALTRDPEALAIALELIDSLHQPLLRFLPKALRFSPPAWLQSHPPVRDRIARLLALASRRTSSLTSQGRHVATDPENRAGRPYFA